MFAAGDLQIQSELRLLVLNAYTDRHLDIDVITVIYKLFLGSIGNYYWQIGNAY